MPAADGLRRATDPDAAIGAAGAGGTASGQLAAVGSPMTNVALP